MNTKFLVIRFMVAITATSSLFMSCDDDISEVGGSALIGSELTVVEESDFTITSGQIDITQPRTNNLDYYLLGDNDHGFGNTKYSILTQLNSYSVLIQESFSEATDDDEQDEDGNDVVLSTTDIDYKLKSATLVIPFKYNFEDDDDVLDSDSNTIQYNIESVISGDNLKINVYESDYILQTSNPNDLSGGVQKYYGDGSDGVNEFGEFIKKDGEFHIIEDYIVDLPNNGDAFSVDLYYDEDEDGDEDDEYSEEGLSDQFPAIRIPLSLEGESNTFIEKLISEHLTNEDDEIDFSLITDEGFTDEFKGLYIETATEDGVVEVLDFSESFVNAGIQMVFTETTTYDDLDDDDNDSVDTEEVITTLQFSEAPINILSKTTSTDLPPADTEEEIILQSGLGRIGIINLFTIEEELETLHSNNILLNDAVLKLTVNTSLTSDYNISNDDLPENIFITELETGSTLIDYTSNYLSTDDDNETLKEGHLMSLVTPEGDETFEPYYEINITQHLSNILRQDEDDSEDSIDANITLALSVTEDLNVTLASSTYNPTEEQFVNQGSLLCFKTVPLYGANYGGTDAIEDDINKRPRLTIKYTPTN